MRFGRYFFLLALLFAVADVCCAARWKAKHVVMIGLDGWGAYSVAEADMPNVKKLMEASEQEYDQTCIHIEVQFDKENTGLM